jgi:hypothetical protein
MGQPNMAYHGGLSQEKNSIPQIKTPQKNIPMIFFFFAAWQGYYFFNSIRHGLSYQLLLGETTTHVLP